MVEGLETCGVNFWDKRALAGEFIVQFRLLYYYSSQESGIHIQIENHIYEKFYSDGNPYWIYSAFRNELPQSNLKVNNESP